MSRIRGKNTKPEMVVRRIAYDLGYRYQLHRRDLPGSPDLVFRGRRRVIFVHGCYWHRHAGCAYAYTPKSNVDFWMKKFEGNRRRDASAINQLRDGGWDVLVIWECQSADIDFVAGKLKDYLGDTRGKMA